MQDQIVVEVADVAAPPPLAKLELVEAFADYEADPATTLDTSVDVSTSKGVVLGLAVAKTPRPHRRASRKQAPPEVKTMSDHQRIAMIRRKLRSSHIRCTCGKIIHEERCWLWTTTHPRKLECPGRDVGLSEEDWKFYQRARRP